MRGFVDEKNSYSQKRSPNSGSPKKINPIDARTGDSSSMPKGGRPPVPIEIIIEAILFRLREGCSWRALSIFAPYTTIYTRWKQWCEQGIWEEIHEIVATRSKAFKGKLWGIDSTSVKVHKHAFGGPQGADYQMIGKSRGGANTKIHALVDGKGRMLRLIGTAGNRHDLIGAFDLVDGFSQVTILADKAYDSDEFREFLDGCELKACIPPKSNRTRALNYHKGHYKHRHHVENFFQRIKEKRAIATRYEKLATRFFDLVTLASIYDWIQN